MEPYRVIVIGGGLRGRTYADIMGAMPEKFKVVAIAEPVEDRRRYFAETFGIPEENCFEDWRPLLAKGKIADVAIVATMDRDHFEPSMAAIELGYHLLLEKPISPVPAWSLCSAPPRKKAGIAILCGWTVWISAIPMPIPWQPLTCSSLAEVFCWDWF